MDWTGRAVLQGIAIGNPHAEARSEPVGCHGTHGSPYTLCDIFLDTLVQGRRGGRVA